MKTNMIIAILGFSLFACTNEDSSIEYREDHTQTNQKKIELIVRKLGLNVNSIEDTGDMYIVEEDLAFSKKELDNIYKSYTQKKSDLRHFVAGHAELLANNKHTIRIKIGDDVPTQGRGREWRDGVPDAIHAWNNVPGSDIRFVLTDGDADVTINVDTINRRYSAYTWLPYDGIPPKSLKVCTYQNDILSSQDKISTLIHEFGHVIGLLHTHTIPNPDSYPDSFQIPNTPNLDYTSIMSYSRDRSNYPGFTQYDTYAIRYLYPSAEYPLEHSINEDGSVTYTLSNYTGTPRWVGVDNASLISGQGTDTATFEVNQSGEVKISVSALFGNLKYAILDDSVNSI